MKKLFVFCVIAAAGFVVTSCEAPATNTAANANSNAAANANTAKPAAAAPTKEALFEMDKKANEAWIKNDVAHFESMLSDKFVSFNNGKRFDKASELAMLKEAKCDVKSWTLEDPQMSKIDNDTYVVSYKGTFDGTCAWEGKTQKIPSPTRGVSVWVREGNNWKGAYHTEVPIIDPKNPPSPTTAQPKNAETKKEDAAPAKPAAGPNTEALVKLHQAGWEAFKSRDSKWFNDHIANNFAFVSPTGDWVGSKADTVKLWTETMKCEGITNVKVSDGVATALSPTVEILTVKGTADGKCDGQPNGDLWQTAIYVKEGDTWKLAFMTEAVTM